MELLPLILLFAVMYFMLIRPQQQRVKAQRELVSSLAVGDDIVTIGGLLGRIVSLDDEIAEIETGNGTILRFRRSAISGKIGPPTGADDTVDISDDPIDPEPPSDRI